MESGITKKHWRVWAWNKVQKIHYISGNFIRMNVLFTFDVEIWCNSLEYFRMPVRKFNCTGILNGLMKHVMRYWKT